MDIQLNQRLDWGNWNYGWMGSYIVEKILKNHIVLRTYHLQAFVNGVLKNNVLTNSRLKLTHKQFSKTLNGRKNEDLRLTDKIVDVDKCIINLKS